MSVHPVCVTCGPVRSERGAAADLPDLRGRAAVCRLGRSGMDDAREPARAPSPCTQGGGRWPLGIGTEPKFAIGQRALLTPQKLRTGGQ